jgi:hypothetical protein
MADKTSPSNVGAVVSVRSRVVDIGYEKRLTGIREANTDPVSLDLNRIKGVHNVHSTQ